MKLVVLLGIVCVGLAVEVSAISMPTGSRLQTVNLFASIINQIQQAIISFVQRLIASVQSFLVNNGIIPSLNLRSNPPTSYDSEDDSSDFAETSDSDALDTNEVSGNKGEVKAFSKIGNRPNGFSGTNDKNFNFNGNKVTNNKEDVEAFNNFGNRPNGVSGNDKKFNFNGNEVSNNGGPVRASSGKKKGGANRATNGDGKKFNFEGKKVSGNNGPVEAFSNFGNSNDDADE